MQQHPRTAEADATCSPDEQRQSRRTTTASLRRSKRPTYIDSIYPESVAHHVPARRVMALAHDVVPAVDEEIDGKVDGRQHAVASDGAKAVLAM